MLWIGPGITKLKLSFFITWLSSSIRFYLFTFSFSESDSRLTILVKLGLTGYSILAAIRIEITASRQISFL